MSRAKRHIKSHYKRPRSHYFVLVLNIVVVCALLVAGAGMLWASNRLNARQVVSLNRDPNGQPSTDAEITPSDSWNLPEGDLAAKNFCSLAQTTAVASTQILRMPEHLVIAQVLASAVTRS